MTGPLITEVIDGSPACRSGIREGDRLLSIEGQALHDVLDYLYLSSGSRFTVETCRGAERRTIQIRKREDHALGLRFDTEIFDHMRLCLNNCPFCFVDQVPREMRKTLKVKDDDYRLSFLNGNFISLTNLKSEDWNKIRDYALSPLYVSIHATNPALRQRIFRHRAAADIMDILTSFSRWGISIHSQIVLCPGINDGAELERTVKELSGFYPAVQSIAIVPVGVTRFLPAPSPLRPLTHDEMKMLIARGARWQREFLKKYGDPLVYLGDEFYMQTGHPIPPLSSYGEFPQIENGVGLVRKMLTQFNRGRGRLGNVQAPPGAVSIITGTGAFPVIEHVAESFRKSGFTIKVHRVINDFWGPGVDVAGLLTGRDILSTLKRDGAGEYVIIPAHCLKDDFLFLDDMTIDDIRGETGSIPLPVNPTYNALRDMLRELGGAGKKAAPI